MKILVSGAGGFIGSHVAEELAKLGHFVVAFSRQVPFPLLNYNNILIKVGDISDKRTLYNALQEAEVVIHCAALLAAKTYNKEKIYEINYYATEKLLELAYKNDIKCFLHISSGGVLGHIDNPPADESYPYNPEDLYEESKMLAEKKVLEYAKKGLYTIVIRPTWSYGERDKRIFKLIKSIKDRKIIKIGKCKNLQHPVYINDLVNGILLALEKGQNGNIYFIGGEEYFTTNQIIDIIAKLLAVKIFPLHIPIAPMKLLAKIMDKIFKKINKEAPFSETKLGFFTKTRAFNINKAKKELHYQPKTNFMIGMQKTIQWYYDNKWLI